MTTFVIVHSGWSAAREWQAFAPLLEQEGHRVYRTTPTGAGERVHLASPVVDLDAHILDVANVLVNEDLREVVLVGHPRPVLRCVADGRRRTRRGGAGPRRVCWLRRRTRRHSPPERLEPLRRPETSSTSARVPTAFGLTWRQSSPVNGVYRSPG